MGGGGRLKGVFCWYFSFFGIYHLLSFFEIGSEFQMLYGDQNVDVVILFLVQKKQYFTQINWGGWSGFGMT